MRVDHVSLDRVEIALSERNLLALLSKARREGSERTLEFDEPIIDEGALPGGPEQLFKLKIVSEPDSEHYADREPGPVHPLDL